MGVRRSDIFPVRPAWRRSRTAFSNEPLRSFGTGWILANFLLVIMFCLKGNTFNREKAGDCKLNNRTKPLCSRLGRRNSGALAVHTRRHPEFGPLRCGRSWPRTTLAPAPKSLFQPHQSAPGSFPDRSRTKQPDTANAKPNPEMNSSRDASS
jgi:hypothetical protein